MIRHRLTSLALAACCAALPRGRAAAQLVIGTPDSQTVRVDNVFRAFDRTTSPGCAVGVYREGQIVYARGYGMANLELGVPNTPRTVFDIGSISKQFAATAILMLEHEGKLSLSDKVRRYFPEMPAYADSVSVRNLLNHTSGIRDMFVLMNLQGRNLDGVVDTADYLRVITRSNETNFPIAARYLYSNSGFALLGQMVYRLSGKSLPQYLRDNVLTPLSMNESRSLDDHTLIIPNRAQGYAPRGAGFRIASSNVDGTAGAGSMHTTVMDFARWDGNWTSGQVGFGMLADSLTVRGRLRNDSAISYALGVAVDSWRGLRTVSHSGAWAGYRAYYVRFPDQHLSVATFCNFTSSGPDTLGLKVAAVYLGHQMGPDTLGAWDSALTSAGTLFKTPAELARYEGVYRNVELGEARRVRLMGDSLMIGTSARTRLVPLGADVFRVGRTNTEITFSGAPGTDGAAPARLVARTRGGTGAFERVPLAQPTDAQLAEYAGDFYNPEIETTYHLAPDSGRLAVSVGGKRLTALEPLWRDGFGSGFLVADFTRDGRGRISGLVVQSGRVRNLRFVRARSPA